VPEDESLRSRIREGSLHTDPLFVVVARKKTRAPS
jgi:hypothetical protein